MLFCPDPVDWTATGIACGDLGSANENPTMKDLRLVRSNTASPLLRRKSSTDVSDDRIDLICRLVELCR